MHYIKRPTLLIMALGFGLALLVALHEYCYSFDEYIPVVRDLPLFFVKIPLSAIGVFFHEIGHAIFRWFYGYIAVPMFDPYQGGGYSKNLTGQITLLVLMIWAGLGYLIWLARDYRLWQVGLGIVLLFNMVTAFTDLHDGICKFMGNGFECVVGGFLLYRAIFDLAPRGDLERFLNAFFGFGLIGMCFVEGFALIHNPSYRNNYYNAKGGHGSMDFDQITNKFFIEFNTVVYLWLALNLICLITPFLLYIVMGGQHWDEDEWDTGSWLNQSDASD